MAITLPDLPFAPGALEPHISARTLELHHGKHHKAYVDKTNDLVKGTELEGKDLEAVIRAAAGDSGKKTLFNQAAQVWNHSFFWQCLRPGGGGRPAGAIASRIEDDFGGYDAFAKEFRQAGTSLFGSGWVWLVVKDDRLRVEQGFNAENPMVHDCRPLLVLDVWEHAYYLDYQNRRADFIDAFLEKLAYWEFADANLGD